jgi:release factor glutamine methyltransferase
VTVASLAREGSAVLGRAGIPTAPRDAEVLLAHVLGVPRARLHAAPDEPVEPAAAVRFREHLLKRSRRVPLQHLTGVQEFWSLEFEVTPAVLIPRPETEGLVEAFLDLRATDAKLRSVETPVVLDVGTGSGCLAVAVAREAPGARLFASDISEEALEVARRNAARHGVAGRITFLRGDLLAPFGPAGAPPADVILTNPPYIGDSEAAGLPPEVRDHEPRRALFAGPDPLAVHRRLAHEARPHLKLGGWLIAEIGAGQDGALRLLYAGILDFHLEPFRPDLAGIPRVLVARAV